MNIEMRRAKGQKVIDNILADMLQQGAPKLDVQLFSLMRPYCDALLDAEADNVSPDDAVNSVAGLMATMINDMAVRLIGKTDIAGAQAFGNEMMQRIAKELTDRMNLNWSGAGLADEAGAAN